MNLVVRRTAGAARPSLVCAMALLVARTNPLAAAPKSAVRRVNGLSLARLIKKTSGFVIFPGSKTYTR